MNQLKLSEHTRRVMASGDKRDALFFVRNLLAVPGAPVLGRSRREQEVLAFHGCYLAAGVRGGA